MARTSAGVQLTQRHRSRQLTLRAATIRDLLVLSRLWNSPFDEFAGATVTLIRGRRRESAGLASEYYRAFRVAEDVAGEATPRIVTAISEEQLLASIYTTGLGTFERSLRAGMTEAAARAHALSALSGATGRHVLNAGRFTVMSSTSADKKALGWQRITAGAPCHFCMMIASRGPVFKSGETAKFRAHDHCACTAEPVYKGGEWTDQARTFRARWDETTAGLSGKDAVNAFRRSLA